MSENTVECDVAIIGAGPVGSTCATLLRKYNPDLRVVAIEKEVFPREHVGESLLPVIMPILHEMGVWDDIERANFPVKLGASFTWGRDHDRWDLDFYPVELWKDEPRPARFEGQRRYTAFQVERAIYDDILKRHAQSLGATVLEGVRVERVGRDGDRVTGLDLSTGQTVRARWYVDGSGVVGMLRRAMEVPRWEPEELRNIAIWDYWENAQWAVEIGTGGTRIQVRSLPYGWIWFIPVGETRTSIGLVCPSAYYRDTGLSVEEIYHKALGEQEEIRALLEGATQRGDIRSCKDWSHLADRLVGENWFLAGESAGFADPILSAGLSLAHGSARDVAYTILELERGELDRDWLLGRYNDRNRRNIEQHIRFAQFWYSANSCFTDLAEHCRRIASEAGLRLNPRQAWRWLSQGGFSTEQAGLASVGSFDLASAKQLLERFDERGRKVGMLIDGKNTFRLNLAHATKSTTGVLRDGRIVMADSYERGGRTLVVTGVTGAVVRALEQASEFGAIRRLLTGFFRSVGEDPDRGLNMAVQALEVMVEEGWVLASYDKKYPRLQVRFEGSRQMRSSEEGRRALEERGGEIRFVFRV